MTFRRFLFLIILGATGAFVFRSYGFEGIFLATDSMSPTLPQGTHVIVNKFVFKFRTPQRGEIIMFETPQVKNKGLVKRVIAIAGDTIEFKNKKIILNGQLVEEHYIQNVRPNAILAGDNLPPIVVPKGFVFVLGDNRDVSGDSRDWKSETGEWQPYVALGDIKGRVLLP